MTVQVGIIMGSKSDWPTMKLAAEMLDRFGIAYETRVVSAHRTPQLLADYAGAAQELRALEVDRAAASSSDVILSLRTMRLFASLITGRTSA